MFRNRCRSLDRFGLSSTAQKRVSPFRANTKGTRCGRPSGPIVASVPERFVATRRRISSGSTVASVRVPCAVMVEQPFRLVVIGDSTSFTDDTGPKLPGDKALYPSVLAARLEAAIGRPVAVSVLARAGPDVREACRVVPKYGPARS